MPRGMSHCRICKKPIPSFFRPYHEKVLCLRMRKLRGDSDMLQRELPKVKEVIKEVKKGQTRLLWFSSTNMEPTGHSVTITHKIVKRIDDCRTYC